MTNFINFYITCLQCLEQIRVAAVMRARNAGLEHYAAKYSQRVLSNWPQDALCFSGEVRCVFEHEQQYSQEAA